MVTITIGTDEISGLTKKAFCAGVGEDDATKKAVFLMYEGLYNGDNEVKRTRIEDATFIVEANDYEAYYAKDGSNRDAAKEDLLNTYYGI